MNNERRNNWKENLSHEANERMQHKMQLLNHLDELRNQLRTCGTDFAKRDEISLQYRETVAKLATF